MFIITTLLIATLVVMSANDYNEMILIKNNYFSRIFNTHTVYFVIIIAFAYVSYTSTHKY